LAPDLVVGFVSQFLLCLSDQQASWWASVYVLNAYRSMDFMGKVFRKKRK